MSEGFGVDLRIAAKTTIRCGLPPPPQGPADVNQWYEAAERLPITRVTGWFGAEIGSTLDDGDIQLFFFDEDHLDPKLRLVAGQDDLVRIWEALGILIRERRLGAT